MEQLGVAAGNFALNFSLIFLSIFVHISSPFPCKIGTGISPGSHQDSRRSPGSGRDLTEVARFPGGILPGKNSRRISRQESRQEISTRRDPAKEKTLLQDPGENPAGKQNLDSIRGENLILTEQKFFHRNSHREVVHCRC